MVTPLACQVLLDREGWGSVVIAGTEKPSH